MTGMAPPGMDPAAMAALHARSFSTTRSWRAAEFAELLADAQVLAVTVPAGFALARLAADEAEILTIAVAPERRGAGLGRALLAELLDRARGRGAARIFLEVAADNDAALKLYAGAGFASCGRRRAYYRLPDGDTVDAVIMARDIA